MLMLANRLLNMWFYLEIWPEVPPDFHHSLSFLLLIIWINDWLDCLRYYDLEHVTQQYNIWLPRLSVTLKENSLCVKMVYFKDS